MEKILVVGAGLVGSLLSTYLAREGYEVHLYDRQQDPRNGRRRTGRSINLTICERGFASLDRLGIGDRVREIAVPCYGRYIHSVDGTVEYQPYGNHREAIHSVSRNELNDLLLKVALEQPGIRLHFEEKCLEVDLDAPEVVFQSLRTDEVTRVRADRVIGADGANSKVRSAMQVVPGFRQKQEFFEQAYKEISVPPAPSGDWALPADAIHIWPRRHYMLIGFPNRDRTFTFALHMPFEGEPSFASIRTPEALLELFRRSFPDALPYVPNLVEDFFGRPENKMITVRCFPWTHGDRMALIGDAAHAIVPSYGQGANSGFEDCSVFFDILKAADGDWARALKEYESSRKPNADAIADLALEHFHELRDFVGASEFLLRKELERWLGDLFPDRYKSLYELVSFTNVPYAEAMRQDREQRTLVDRLLAIPDVRQKLDSPEIREMVDRFMAAVPPQSSVSGHGASMEAMA
ncbi:MAG: FAD-dependent monooxygenase [Acidobacteriota bacterium]